MKKIIIVLLLLLNVCINVNATNTSTIVMDVDSGRILYQNNAYERRLIASTTKIMTFIIAYEYGKEFLDVEVEAGEEVLKMYGTSIYLSYKEKMTLRDLLYGLMLRSGNDAAVVIANFIGGSEEKFVELMNKKANFLGMHNTTFNNPHGLDEETQNYSTAYDMAKLSQYANKIPFYQEVTSTKYYKTQTENKAYSWTNRNKLVFNYDNFISGKTGYTPSAGKTFVSTAKKDNLILTTVSLNDANIYDNHKLLYEEMFNKYEKYCVVNYKTFPIKSQTKNNKAYIKENIYYPVKENEKENISIKIILNNENRNNVIGELKAYYKEQEIKSINIYQELDNKKKEENFLEKVKKFFIRIFTVIAY